MRTPSAVHRLTPWTGPIPIADRAVEARDPLVIGVAVAVPEPFGQELTAWRARFGDARAGRVPAHVTLVPPTPLVGVDLVDAEEHLTRAVRGVGAFRLRLAGTGTFRPTSPVVFVSVARGAAELDALQQRVRRGPLARDLAFDYHPHVTVAQEVPDSALDEAMAVLAGWSCEFPVDHLTLYKHHDDGVWRPAVEVKLPG